MTLNKKPSPMSGSAFLSVVRPDIISELIHVQYRYSKGQKFVILSIHLEQYRRFGLFLFKGHWQLAKWLNKVLVLFYPFIQRTRPFSLKLCTQSLSISRNYYLYRSAIDRLTLSSFRSGLEHGNIWRLINELDFRLFS